MTEKEIKGRAIERLEKWEYAYWFPPKVKFYQQDIFGVFDLVAAHEADLILVQLTTKSNLSHRRKKIQKFFAENNVRLPLCYIWAWDEAGKDFYIEQVFGGGK